MSRKKKTAAIIMSATCIAVLSAVMFNAEKVSAYLTAKNSDKAVATVSVGDMKIRVEKTSSDEQNTAFFPGGHVDYSYQITKTGNIPADVYQIVTIKTSPADGQTFKPEDATFLSLSIKDGTFKPDSEASVKKADDLYTYYVIHTKASELPTDPSVMNENFELNLGRNAGDNFKGCTIECHVDVFAVEDTHKIITSKVMVDNTGTLYFYDDYSQFASDIPGAEAVKS